MLRNTRESWGAPAKFFHWGMAALVFAQFALGWSAAEWRLSPLKLDLFVWHKSIGMLILVMLVLRLGWRLANSTPAMPVAMLPWEQRAARANHFFLYALLIAMPISGWIINSAKNIPFRAFWVMPVPAIAAPREETAEWAAMVHLTLFVVLVIVLGIHIGAALRHHYVKRDGVLARMLPSAREP